MPVCHDTASSRRNQAAASRIGLGFSLLGTCGAAGGLLAGYGIARALNRKVVQLSAPVRDMADELDQVVGPVVVSSDADLAELGGALRELSAKTADLVRSLQESQRQTIRAEQLAAVGQLAAGLAHELRYPLMSLKLLVQTARERAEVSGLPERDLEVMEEEIGRLERMLQTFLDFARPPQPQMATLNVAELIERTVRVARPRADRQNIKITADCQSTAVVEGDESQLGQVLLNLVLNALDALPQGGNIWIRAELAASPELRPPAGPPAADALVIRVSDDGPGVSSDVQSRVFEPFVSTKPTGVGLGLSISRRIVQMHGGGMTAGGRKGGGAEFVVRLPLPADAAASATVDRCWPADRRESLSLVGEPFSSA